MVSIGIARTVATALPTPNHCSRFLTCPGAGLRLQSRSREGSFLASSLFGCGVALELGERMGLFHPADAFGGLDLDLEWVGVRIVEGGGLDVDQAGEDHIIGVEKPRSALAAEVAASVFR